MTISSKDHARRLEAEASFLMQLLAGLQQDLAACVDCPAATTAARAVSGRQAALARATTGIQKAHRDLEARLEERTVALASREAALAASRDQLRTLTRRIVQVQEDERRSLARDLHDTSGQAMTVLGVGLAMLAREAGCSEKTLSHIADLRGMAETVAEDLHRLSLNLRPSSLDRYGLVPALDELIRTLRKQAGLEVDFTVEGLEERLPADTETALYRIVQEACTNIIRYAGATRAAVAIRRDGEVVTIHVEDNGSGFQVDEARSGGRLGLLGMQERAEMLSGTFSVESEPGRGTLVDVRVPASNGPSEVTGVAATEEPFVDDVPRLGAPTGSAAAAGTGEAGVDLSEASELARAKVLSDVLVEISAGMSRRATSEEVLSYVLAGSAEAIDCDYAVTVLRDGDQWVVSQGYRLPEFAVGRRLADADVPAAVEIERIGRLLFTNDMRVDGPVKGYLRESGALSAAGIPLAAGGKFIGVLAYVHTAAAVPFSPSEITFLERLSTLVSLALENILLREHETRQREVLEAVLSSINDGLIIYDMDGRVSRMNRAAEEIVGRLDLPADLTLPDLVRYVQPRGLDLQAYPLEEMPAQRALRGETVRGAVMALHLPAGVAWVSSSAAPILGPGGIQQGAVSTYTDIKPLHEAQQQLEAANRHLESAYAELQSQAAERGEVNRNLEEERDRWRALAVEITGKIEGEAARKAAQEQAGRLAAEYNTAGDQGGRPVGASTVLTSAGEPALWQEANAHLLEREAVLQRNLAELDGILRALPSGLIVYNAEGRIVRTNGPAKDMLGFDEETWKQPVSERATVAVQVFRPDGTPIPRDEYAALRALRGEAVHNEDVFIHLPDRPERDFWALLSACPIKEADGELIGAVVTMADTGDFHRVSEELGRANAELEAILASIPDGLLVNDVDGSVTRMNAVAEEMLRYTAEERSLQMSSRLPSKMALIRPDGSPYAFEEYPPVRALRGEVMRSQEVIMRTPGRPDDDARVLASAGPIRTPAGKLLGAVTILTDISDLHEARSRLQEANVALRAQTDQLREAAEGLEHRISERTASLQQATHELEQAQSQLQALSRRLVQVQEDERSYVADQLYNQAAQVLAALKMQLWSLERSQQHQAPAAQWAEMKETLDQTIHALHDLAAELRPAGLDRLPIATVLRDYVSRFVQAGGISFSFDAGGTQGLHLEPAVMTAVFRSVQEALTNIGRHAAATEVALTLRRTGDRFVVTLKDNGVGFDPVDALNGGGVGLISIRERIESVRGHLTISSTPGGTTLIAEVPLDNDPRPAGQDDPTRNG